MTTDDDVTTSVPAKPSRGSRGALTRMSWFGRIGALGVVGLAGALRRAACSSSPKLGADGGLAGAGGGSAGAGGGSAGAGQYCVLMPPECGLDAELRVLLRLHSVGRRRTCSADGGASAGWIDRFALAGIVMLLAAGGGADGRRRLSADGLGDSRPTLPSRDGDAAPCEVERDGDSCAMMPANATCAAVIRTSPSRIAVSCRRTYRLNHRGREGFQPLRRRYLPRLGPDRARAPGRVFTTTLEMSRPLVSQRDS